MSVKNYPSVTLTDVFVAPISDSTIVDYLAFANNSADQVAVTIQDGDGHNFLPATVVEPNMLTRIPLPDGGLWFKNGVRWKAGTPGVVDAWIREVKA